MIRHLYLLFAAALTMVFVSASKAFAVPVQVLKPGTVHKAIAYKPGEVVEQKISSGDTLSQILEKQKVSYEDINSILLALRKVYDPNGISEGQKLRLIFDDQSLRMFQELSLAIEPTKDIIVKRIANNVFLGFEQEKQVSMRLMKAKGKIKSSFYGAMADAGVPVAVIMKLIKLSSYDIDFQREVRKGDEFVVLFEQKYTSEDDVVGQGEVVYTKLTLKHKKVEMYRYQTRDQIVSYYDGEGSTVQKSLLRTPVDGARISSGFGVRKHPVLGYTKMHRGVDFAAPTGTPVYAAGSGTITSLGRKGSYGKYIRIDHGNGYATAYAHLSRFRKGKRRNSQVKQGEVIGYVGKTGRATGAHLHYEILKQGRQINPRSIKTTPGKQLKSLERGIFEQYKRQIHKLVQ